MPAKSVVLGSCALIALSVAAAQAGPCSTEIEGLTKTMASKDAGSGPTSGATGAVAGTPPAAGQHPPTTTMSQATQGGAASPQDVRQQTAGQPAAAQQGSTGAAAAHPPTAATTQATQGQAAPSAGGHPPTAAMSQATQGQAAPSGNTGHQTASAGPMDASAALAHARDLDKQGKEAECMQAVQQAKQLSGSK
jgi:hypothetical protein